MFRLKHIINTVVVSDIELAPGEFTIGRNDGNTLQLDDGVVSGQHACLTVVENEYMPEVLELTIRDLGSTNGTYVNGEKVLAKRLKNQDVIRVGTNEFKVHDDAANTGTQTEYYIPDEN